MLFCALQLRNILQHIDNYLNKSGKREGEKFILIATVSCSYLSYAFSGILGFKKVGGAGSCNCPTDATNFQRNSNRQLQISDKRNYECPEF